MEKNPIILSWQKLRFFILFVFFEREPDLLSIDKKGHALKEFYLACGLRSYGYRTAYKLGDGVTGQPEYRPDIRAHCSAFRAAACKRQPNIYILRPPDHLMQLLANAIRLVSIN
jgi:hypothetical protein